MRLRSRVVGGLCGCVLAVAASADPAPRAVTAQGEYEGAREGTVAVFRGVPYAAAPVGSARWRPPEPAPGFAGVRSASRFGPICPQIVPAFAAQLADRPQSEDCLSLNVWSPLGASRAPVLFWIHGGANRFGSGSDPLYDGRAFAKQGVIVVTINYRLGYLGFFGHPALDVGPGPHVNYGLLDALAALRWVKANISGFGGDPNRITVAGESAGGAAVLDLLVMPEADGLFSQAIVESGGGAAILRKTVADAEEVGIEIAKKLGFKGKRANAEALRAVPAARFLDPAVVPAPAPGFGPVIDGTLLTDFPIVSIRAGKSARVPMLIGINSNEGSLMEAYRIPPQRVVTLFRGNRDDIREAYGDLAKDPPAYARALYGDVIFAAPARRIATAQGSLALVWLYDFDYVAEKRRGSAPGVPHGGELPYFFDTLDAARVLSALATSQDEQYAAQVNACVAAFIRDGDPRRAPLCMAWRPYDAARDNWFRFSTESTEVLSPGRRQLDAIDLAMPQPRAPRAATGPRIDVPDLKAASVPKQDP
jgi:para-nitrobenzyl esterase